VAGGALNLGGPAFGILSAVSWGTGDFGGGLISRYSSALTGVATSEGVGLIASVLIAIVAGEPLPSAGSFEWSLAAGVAGVIGLGAFYYALSRGTMGVVAPLAALIGAGLPVVVGLAAGEELDLSRGVGMTVALVAVVLISLPGGEKTIDERRLVRIDIGQLPFVVTSGLGFGVFFISLDEATTAGEMWWPLVIVRLVGLALIGVAIVVGVSRGRQRTWRSRTEAVLGLAKLRARRVALPMLALLVLVTGAGDLGGNTFFVLAARTDALSVAVVLSSLYPVVTTVLAAIFLRERLRPAQLVGVVLASLSVPLLR
jgi:drug/metabolite transporter (DMT)-like permease